jgi:hypothetical protein
MNDRLPKVLLDTLANRFPLGLRLLPDEPTFNYLTRTLRITGRHDRRRTTASLFGSASVRVERPLHAGFAHFAYTLSGMEALNGRYLAEAHTMLRLFKPFSAQDRYERTLDQTLTDRATGIFERIGARPTGVFRNSPACCVACTEVDQDTHRPPHYRRSHQVIACQVCPEHGTVLTTRCESCAAPLSFTDLPSLKCQSCGANFQPGQLDSALASNPALALRLAQVVQSSLNGLLVVADETVRLTVLRERIQSAQKNRSGLIGDNLALRICRTYGPQFLETLSLLPTREPTLGWPALMLHGRHLSQDPIANCLLIAMSFESVEAYNDAVSRTSSQILSTDKTSKLLTGCMGITRAILKDVLRPGLLREVAANHGIDNCILTNWVAAYPGLSQRRKLTGRNVLLRRNKRLILRHQANNPTQSRSQVAAVLSREVAQVRQHDRAWLDRHLPVQEGLSGATAAIRTPPKSEKDKALAAALCHAVETAKATKARPRRFAANRIEAMSGIAMIDKEQRTKFPLTTEAIARLTESVEDYYRRCLNWAAEDLIRCRGRCDHVIELFVHAHVSLDCVRNLEDYARTLITDSQFAH